MEAAIRQITNYIIKIMHKVTKFTLKSQVHFLPTFMSNIGWLKLFLFNYYNLLQITSQMFSKYSKNKILDKADIWL